MKQLLLIILFSTAIFGQTGKSVLTQAQKDSINAMIGTYIDTTTAIISGDTTKLNIRNASPFATGVYNFTDAIGEESDENSLHLYKGGWVHFGHVESADVGGYGLDYKAMFSATNKDRLWMVNRYVGDEVSGMGTWVSAKAGGTYANPTTPIDGSNIGGLMFSVYDTNSTSYRWSAGIKAYRDGASYMGSEVTTYPVAMSFYTRNGKSAGWEGTDTAAFEIRGFGQVRFPKYYSKGGILSIAKNDYGVMQSDTNMYWDNNYHRLTIGGITPPVVHPFQVFTTIKNVYIDNTSGNPKIGTDYIANSYIEFTDGSDGWMDFNAGYSTAGFRFTGYNGIVAQNFNYGQDTSTTDAYKIALSGAVALVAGLELTIKVVTANTDGATLTVNNLTTKAITKASSGAVNTALATGDILAGQVIKVVYDGTQFQIISRLAQ